MSSDFLFQGDNGFYWWVGTVENNGDPLATGRCQVRIKGVHSDSQDDIPTEYLPWAIPGFPISNANVGGIGNSPVGPQPGTRVLGFFADGIKKELPIFFLSLPGTTSTDITRNISLQDGSTPVQPTEYDIVTTYKEDTEVNNQDPSDTSLDTGTLNQTYTDTRNIVSKSGDWVLPITGFVSDSFGTRGGRHKGVDISTACFTKQSSAGSSHLQGKYVGATGSPVYAAADGNVVRVWKSNVGKGGVKSEYDTNLNVSPNSNQRSFGNAIAIQHNINGENFITVYAHLGQNQNPGLDTPGNGILVSVGQKVTKGQQIGTVGRSHNRDSFTHLHFEIRHGAGGFPTPINPGIIFPQLRNKHMPFISWCIGKKWDASLDYSIDDAPVKALESPE